MISQSLVDSLRSWPNLMTNWYLLGQMRGFEAARRSQQILPIAG
jgi:hypothetical protein